MDKLRIGLIGTGGLSNSHTREYLAHPEVDFVALCDINEQRLKAYSEKYGVKNCYSDYNEMLAKEKLDAVSICTWNSAHKAPTIAALNAGVNVLCEKPMALNAAEAQEMLDAAEKNNKLLMIGFVLHYASNSGIAKKFIDAGQLGDIYYGKATYIRRDGCPGGWFGDKSYSGGGPLIDIGVHVTDLSRYLAGNPKPVTVSAVTYKNLGKSRASSGGTANFGYDVITRDSEGYVYDVEDMVSAFIRFDNGFTLQVLTSFALNIKSDYTGVELFGTKAGLKLDTTSFEIYADSCGYYTNLTPANVDIGYGPMFRNEIGHFIDCIRGRAECQSHGREGVEIMKIIDAVYRSAAENREIAIAR